jgi:branched-subunit amino acid ABC-type transport system permease component
LACLVLAGCGWIGGDDAERFCRSLIPAFNDPGDRIETTSRSVRLLTLSRETMVSLSYRTVDGVGQRRLRAFHCLLSRTATVDRSGIVGFRLLGAATEEGALGELRLHLLRRTWIESGRIETADPAAVTILSLAPRVSSQTAAAMQTLLAALPAISIYALLATAYALIYGLIGRINLAFGDIAMLSGYGAFLGFALLTIFGGDASAAVLAAVALGLATAAIWGLALGRFVLAPLATRPGQHILIATAGVSIAVAEAMRLAQGAGVRWMSPLLSRVIGVAESETMVVTLTPMAVLVALTAGTASWLTVIVMRRTRAGRAWRAVADDSFAAEMLGLDARRVLVYTAMLASLLAGVAGVLVTLHYGGVGHSGGLSIGLKALLAAVLGGIGSIGGAMLGGIAIGLGETLWAAVFSIETRDIALFSLLAVAIVMRSGVDRPR